MSYLDDDDQVSELERYLRQVQVNPDIDGAPSLQNYVQPADQQPNYVDPSNNPPQPQQVDPGDLGLMNPPPPKFSVVPPDSFNQDAAPPKIASKPGTGADQYIKDIGQSTFDHAPIPEPPAFTGAAPGAANSNLYTDQRKYGTPIDPRDPKYRMGTGQRILGTIGNALSAFGHSNSPIIDVGPGATNRRYAQDVAAQKANLESTQTQIKSGMDLAEENRKQYQTGVQAQERAEIGKRNAAQAQKYANAVDPNSIRYDETNDKWIGKTYGGQEQEVTEPKWSQQLKAKDPQTVEAGQRAARSAAIQSLGENSGYTQKEINSYILTGKMPDNDFKARELELREAEFGLKKSERDRKTAEDGGQWFKGNKELADYKNRTRNLDAEAAGLARQRAYDESIGITSSIKNTQDRLTEIDKEKAGIQQQIVDARQSNKAPSAPAGKTSAPPKSPALTPIPDKQMTSPKGNIVRIGDKNPLTGQVVKGFARDSSGAVHATF